MTRLRLAARWLAVLVLAWSAEGVFDASRQVNDRLLVVISDLHFGVGRAGQSWHAMEDFRWAPEFQGFLDEVNRRGAGKTDLVIAGDAFELWQSAIADDCAPENRDAACSESEALARLKHVASAHDVELKALGAFAASGDNRVVFVPGNHDAALLFPLVAQAAVTATGAPVGRVRVEPAGWWLSPDGSILVEHGHQIGRELNRLAGWPRPFVGANPVRLERSWGEQFVQRFYNQYEAKYPIIDNVSEEGTGIRYAREVEGWLGTASAAGRFVTFYLTKLSLAQHVAVLGPGGSPNWDLDAVRAQSPRFLAESLPSDDPVGAAARKGGVDLSAGFNELSSDDLRAICNARADIYAYQIDKGTPPTITRCPVKDGTLGAVAQGLSGRSRHAIVGEYLIQRFSELRNSKQLHTPFKTFIYGHTHGADGGFRPLAASHPDWNPLVVNTGAWQRTATPDQLAGLVCRVAPNQNVIELQPDELPPCYGAVIAWPGNAGGTAVLYWTRDGDKGWLLNGTCRWTPPCRKQP